MSAPRAPGTAPETTLVMRRVSDDHDPPLSPGVTVGRFRLGALIGEGGMGTVYEARDADLGRTIAIKLVHSGANDGAGARLLREAQAMARLSHPNVVAIYEVGSFGAQIFLAMERVHGVNLAEWLAARSRTWRAIVEVLVQGGDGLAAAHAVGLIHRDFKPGNLLVDDRGHARVGDFGIALLASQEEEAGGDPGAPRTTTGTRNGTPAYMAPEQAAGGAIDARADQYSFAVTLHEALYGRRPDQPPRKSDAASSPRVPARVRRVLTRAFAVDPSARFSDMNALVAELRRALARRRQAVLGVVAVLLVASAATAGAVAGRPQGARCADGAHMVDTVWNARARLGVLASFARSGRAYAGATTRSAFGLVDDWADGWRLARRAACASEPELQPGWLACLDRQLAQLRADLAVWVAPDGEGVDRAVSAARELPDVASCRLRGHGAPTQQAPPALVARTVELAAKVRAGHLATARAALPALIDEVERVGDTAVLATLLLTAATVASQLDDVPAARLYAERAAQAAADAHDDPSLVRALLAKARGMVAQGRADEAVGVIDAAEALRRRAGIDGLELDVLQARGDAFTHAGQPVVALAELQRALELAERRPAASGALALTVGLLAGAHLAGREFEAAREGYARQLALQEATLGSEHPEVGRTLHNLAASESLLSHFDDARAHFERARRIIIAASGDHSPSLGAIEFSIGELERNQGNSSAARVHFTAALALLSPTRSIDVPVVETALGMLDRDEERCGDALPRFARALALYDLAGNSGIGPTSTRTNMGMCLLDLGRLAEARPMLERALAELEAAQLPALETAYPLIGLADVAAGEGRRSDAIALANRALATVTGDPALAAVEFRTYIQERLDDWRRGRP